MNRVVNINNNKKRLKLYYGLLVTVLCIIGVSFAWFRLYLSQSENNTLSSRTCFNTTLTEDNSKIELTDAFPIIDSEGLKQAPFTFTIKNNCDGYVQVYITIDSAYRTSTNTSYLKDEYIKVNISPKDTTENKSLILGEQSLTDLDNNSKGYVLITTGLKANEEKSYDLRIWMDSSVTTDQGLNKTWAGKLVVVTNASKEPPTFAETILANNEVKTPLTTPGTEVSAYKESDVTTTNTDSVSSTYQNYYVTYGTGWEANGTKFNLTGASVTTDTYANSYASLVGKYLPQWSILSSGSSTAGTMKTTTNLSSVYYVVSATANDFTYKTISSNKNQNEALLASAEDDYGTSYYFRGTVTNNYVEFANKCWRIVRIGGDNTVKLILHNDNTSNVYNPCSSANNSTTAAFAHYAGSTYTSAFNSNHNDNAYVGFMYGTPGSSTYEATHANINKSTILTNLETWYNNNLKTYESVIDDNVFCNDKNISDTECGYDELETTYNAYNRKTPVLICEGELSKITSKIGLITYDELVFAGFSAGRMVRKSNFIIYLQENATGNNWWSLSPARVEPNSHLGGDAHNYYVNIEYGIVRSNRVDFSFGLRPYISLKSSVKTSGGSGTSEEPYIINS